MPLHWAIKFPLILAITLTVLLASYHYLVRPTLIGEILNGRKYPRARARRTSRRRPRDPDRAGRTLCLTTAAEPGERGARRRTRQCREALRQDASRSTA